MKHCPRCNTTYGDDVAACPLDGAALSSAPRQDPLLDRVIKGRYRIVGKLGDGGMGSVYRAEQLSVGRAVALKVLHREFARDEEFVQRFHQEARLAAALNHPRLTTVFDFDQSEDGSLFIVMEYLQGTLLNEVIRRDSPLEIGRVVRLGIQIAEGIGAAHAAGVIHRDIKPQNVFVLPGDNVKLMDFGIARRNDGRDVHLTRAGTMMGTPQYMAPEQIEGRAVSEKTDIYAFGIVLYEMLSGKTPFSAPTSTATLARALSEPPPPLRGLRPDVPPLLEQVVMQALEKEPEYRQDRIADVARRLTSISGTASVIPPGPPGDSATIVVAPRDSRVVAAAPDAGMHTVMATPTMVAGAREQGTIVSATPPGVTPARPSAWARLREGRGKTLAISAAIVAVMVAAVLVWWTVLRGPERSMARVPPAPEVKSGVAVATPDKPTPDIASQTTAAPPPPPPVVAPVPPPPIPPPRPSPAETKTTSVTKKPEPVPPPPPIPRPDPVVVVAPPPQPLPAPPSPQTEPARPQDQAPRPPPPPPPPPRREPSEIKAFVEQKLRAERLLREGRSLGVEVEAVGRGGVVILKGVVRTSNDKQRAAAIVRGVDGVTDVDDSRVNAQESWTQQNSR